MSKVSLLAGWFKKIKKGAMNMHTRCRLCMAPCNGDELRPMLATWNDSINLWSMYDFVMNAGANVHSASKPYSCTKCSENLKTAYDFQLMCTETERTLSELVKQSANESETENESVPCNDNNDDFIEEDVKVFVDVKEDVDNKGIERVEVVTDAKVLETKDNDLCEQSGDANIEQVEAIEDIDRERTNTKSTISNCRKCDMKFETLKDYWKHHAQVHRRAYQRKIHKDRPHSCQLCDIRFDNLNLYQVHYRRTHQRSNQRADSDGRAAKVICTICGKLIGKRAMLKHIRKMHSNDDQREHTCTICGKSFKWIENLNLHARIHKNDKRYACKFCGEKFLHWSGRKNHIIAKHTGEKNYDCNICGKKFSQGSNLLKHIRAHQNELPHACTICPKRFIGIEELTKHQIGHLKDKNLICDICKKCFRNHRTLKNHIKTHSEKNHVCPVCDKSLSTKHNLRRHLKGHPGVEMPMGKAV